MTAAPAQEPTLTLPRRVLLSADTLGGVWTFALELARGFLPYGIEVALATLGALPTQEQRQEVAGIPNITLWESGYRLEWMEDPWEDVERSGEWLLSLGSRIRPDLVHLNGYAHAALPWSIVTAHSCVLSRWSEVKRSGLPSSYLR